MRFYVYEINPLTLPIALFWSLFGEVFFWKTSFVKRTWLRRLNQLSPALFFNWDQWKSFTENVFFLYRDNLSKFDLRLTDPYEKILLQHSSIETEHWYLFEKLVVAHSQRFATNKINFVGYQNTLATRILKLKFSEGFTRTWTLSLALASWRKIKTVSSWSRELLFALRVSSSQTPPKLSCWWIGISSYEVPTESGKLDFAFAVRGKRAEGHYYLLPSEPTSVQKAWLSQNKVYWGLAHFPQSNLDFINRLKFILKSLEILITHFRSKLAQEEIIVRQRGAAWELAIAEFSPSRLMASISASWPETPAIAAFALKKLPSVVWFYGSNMFGFNFERSEFQDLDVTFISPAAQEFWVWNEASIKAWSRRHLLPQDQQPKYRVIGPTMCGDRAWIELSAKQARQKFGVSENRSDFFISIFDVPTMTEAVRAAYGAGPSIYPVEMNERLIRDFFRIATSHPRVRLMFKLKRPANDPTREFSEAIKELLGTHQSAIVNDRITLFPADTDPYIPIAMADLAVGLPFTSPVFAAACSGRHGLHYDPLGAIRILPHKGLDEFLISGFDQLEKTIEKILNSDWQMNRERVRSYISTRQNELNFDKEISK